MSKSKKEYHIQDLIIDDEYGIIDSNASIQDAAKKISPWRQRIRFKISIPTRRA